MGNTAQTLEYEKLCLALIGDVEVVALEGYCSECKKPTAVQMKILEYYQSHAHVSLVITSCPLCNSPHLTLATATTLEIKTTLQSSIPVVFLLNLI